MARPNVFDPNNIIGKNIYKSLSDSPLFTRHLLDTRINCQKCGALVWIEEKSGGSIRDPLFSICCNKGKVKLPEHKGLPQYIETLLSQSNELGKHFVEKIRAYNSLFAFTSFKANVYFY
jgi:hypothetical protein